MKVTEFPLVDAGGKRLAEQPIGDDAAGFARLTTRWRSTAAMWRG